MSVADIVGVAHEGVVVVAVDPEPRSAPWLPGLALSSSRACLPCGSDCALVSLVALLPLGAGRASRASRASWADWTCRARDWEEWEPRYAWKTLASPVALLTLLSLLSGWSWYSLGSCRAREPLSSSWPGVACWPRWANLSGCPQSGLRACVSFRALGSWHSRGSRVALRSCPSK